MTRATFKAYQRTKDGNPSVSEQEIAENLFDFRFGHFQNRKEKDQLIDFLASNPRPNTLRKLCYFIATIENPITEFAFSQYDDQPSNNIAEWETMIHIIDKELDRLGYTEEA